MQNYEINLMKRNKKSSLKQKFFAKAYEIIKLIHNFIL